MNFQSDRVGRTWHKTYIRREQSHNRDIDYLYRNILYVKYLPSMHFKILGRPRGNAKNEDSELEHQQLGNCICEMVFFLFVRISPSISNLIVSKNRRSVPSSIHPFRDSQKETNQEIFWAFDRSCSAAIKDGLGLGNSGTFFSKSIRLHGVACRRSTRGEDRSHRVLDWKMSR
jgi:hypothetical protein